MTRRTLFAHAAVFLAAALAATGASAADAGQVRSQQILKPPPGAHTLAKRCAPGFRLFSNPQSTTYGCVFGDVVARCRRKYEFAPEPSVTKTGKPLRFMYACSKTKPGKAAPSLQDCAPKFRRTAELPNQGYRCFLPFVPRCQAGYEAGPPLVHRSGNEISVRYTCKKKPASSGIEPVDRE